MADTKVSAAADPVTLVGTDKVPIARSGSTVSYAATMAEVAAFAGSTAAGVTSFNTRTGAVTLSIADVTGAGGAPLASPTFTGTPNLPTGTVGVTQTAGNNTTALATTAFVTATVAPYANDVGRNRLHNSRFTINQRGYTTGTALAAGAYGFDRWKAGASGCTLTFTAATPSTTVTITAGSLQQIVEALSVDGGTYTLSWTGTAQGRVNAGTYAASPLTVTGLSSNTAITVEFNTGTLAGIQLEQGAVATPLEKPDPQQDLAKCQRFAVFVTGWGVNGYSTAGATAMTVVPFPVPMRAVPLTTIQGSPIYSNCSALGVNQSFVNGWQPVITVTTTAAFGAAFNWFASADL